MKLMVTSSGIFTRYKLGGVVVDGVQVLKSIHDTRLSIIKGDIIGDEVIAYCETYNHSYESYEKLTKSVLLKCDGLLLIYSGRRNIKRIVNWAIKGNLQVYLYHIQR